MNKKKYILTEETKVVEGHILRRIQAVRDFGDVKAGDLKKGSVAMNKKKYILTEETKVAGGHMLRRIQAVRDFGNVKAGDLGGWIEKEENLSHNGLCWVYNDAQVFRNACIFDNAQVFGNAKVYGNAWIYENARVYGNVQVYGVARVYGNAQVFGDVKVDGKTKLGYNAYIAKYDDFLVIGPIGSRSDYTTFYRTEHDGICVSCGCFNDSIDTFIEQVSSVHERTPYLQEYLAAINFVNEIRGGK